MNLESEDERTNQLAHARGLFASGSYPDAKAAILDYLETNIPDLEACLLLVEIESALDRPIDAARALERAIALQGTSASSQERLLLWLRLADVRVRCGDLVGALAAFENAARLDTGNEAAIVGMAKMYLLLQDLSAAARVAKDLLRLFPASSFSYLFDGHVHKALGIPSIAIKRYTEALDIEPSLGEALYNLVDLVGPEFNADMTARIERMLARNDLGPADMVNARFAHARVLDRLARYEDAFDSLKSANDLARDELARRGVRYSASRVEARIAQTIADYPEVSVDGDRATLPIDLVPVFIVGMPRSGTTLIEQILASHSDVQAAGEIAFAHRCEYEFRRGRRAAGRTGSVNPDNPVDRKLLAAARELYVDQLFERDLDGRWIVDKLPANFEIAGFLRLMFPDAPIIHSVRNRFATCFSLYFANFGSHEPWYHDLGDLAHYYAQYERLMAHWMSVICEKLVTVTYEDLVTEPLLQIPQLLESTGLPFDKQCLAFFEHERPIFTASHSQVRQPIYTGSIDHWTRYSDWLGPLRCSASAE